MNDRAVIGDSPRRRENARFVTGHGAYLDDLRFEGLTQAVSRRSPHAHARINGIDTANALKTGGVIAILTAAEAAADLGGGHGSSRATYMGGTAIWRASDTIITKGKTLAAQALEAAETDIVFGDGLFRVTGNDRTITLLELETNFPGALDICNQWTREAMTFPNGTHIAESWSIPKPAPSPSND
jgi:CO/xanthine dehydrogenase Mo-binding subunit